MTIKVHFDDQIFQLQKHGGISKYFSQLIKEFNLRPELGIQPVVSTFRTANHHLLNDSGLTSIKKSRGFFGPLRLVFQSIFSGRKSLNEIDLVHFTFYLPGFFFRNRGLPTVSTVHDMIPEKFPEPGRFWNPHFSKKSYLKKSDLVISVSKTTAEDMADILNITRSVTTTYLGVGPEFQPGLSSPDGLSSPYFLYVGNRNGYKDFQTCIYAFAVIAGNNPNVRLQLVGGGSPTKSEKKTMRALGVEELVFQKDVPSDQLPNYYSAATALLYSSRYEGFGLPLVEAMASGIPILCANSAINSEVCGSAGNYFEPGDSHELAQLMSKVLQAPENFENKVEVGLEKSKIYSWRRCAEETAMAYRSLLSQKEGRGF
jgi:glycosyltransferase involved in cell wall biosynthesis